jgi:hypothetical protein
VKKIINPYMTLLAVGVLKPASASDVVGFLRTVFGNAGAMPSLDEFRDFFAKQLVAKRILQVNKEGESHYSLTLSGSLYLPVEIRKMRDKFRAYLLRDSHRGRFIESREIGEGLAGASPAVDVSSGVKGRAANKLGRREDTGQAYWPRISGQFTNLTVSQISAPRRCCDWSIATWTSRQASDERADQPSTHGCD